MYDRLKMLESVAAECHKRKAILQFANATKRMERSIKASIPREHISFVTDVFNFKSILFIFAASSLYFFLQSNARDYPVSFVSEQVYKF